MVLYKDENGKTSNIAGNYFDLSIVYPIGVTYVQYPNCPSPEELFPNLKWELQDYDGCFFRAEGTNALDYDGGVQDSGVPNATGTYAQGGFEGPFNSVTSGIFYNAKISYTYKYHESSTGSGTYNALGMNLSRASSVYQNGLTEARPKNQTIRIWKRIA